MRPFQPKHTVASVAETLHKGFTDGTIVLDQREPILFPSLPELVKEIAGSYELPLPEFRPELATQLISDFQAPYFGVVQQLELLIRLTGELRHNPTRSLAEDLSWQTQFLGQKISRVGVLLEKKEFLQRMLETMRLGRMLTVAVEQTTSIIEELSIQFQLSLVVLFKEVVEIAASHISQQLSTFIREHVQQKEGSTRQFGWVRHVLTERVETAISKAKESRLYDLQLFIETLQLALTRSQRLEGTTTRSQTFRTAHPSPDEL